MVELLCDQIKNFDRHSSKGNQLKWKRDNTWFKADYTGYEGLAEYVISELLKKSSLNRDEFVSYQLETIKYKRSVYNGVSSLDFLQDDWQIITLERLYKNYRGVSLLESAWKYPDVEDRLAFLVDEVIAITGITDFGQYLSKMLTIDAFFLNEDRHMHNVAVLMNENSEYRLCPIFDNGAALLSDTTQDYPLSEDVIEMIDEVKSKTICTDFDEQLDAVENKYGYNIKFSFSKNDVDNILAGVDIYPKEVIERVRTILYQRIRKFQYLF